MFRVRLFIATILVFGCHSGHPYYECGDPSSDCEGEVTPAVQLSLVARNDTPVPLAAVVRYARYDEPVDVSVDSYQEAVLYQDDMDVLPSDVLDSLVIRQEGDTDILAVIEEVSDSLWEFSGDGDGVLIRTLVIDDAFLDSY